MKLINRGRGTGKTSILISAAHITGMPIIVCSSRQKINILDAAKKMNCDIEVFTDDEFTYKNLGTCYKDKGVLIDECEDIIDAALYEYLGVDVVAGTMSVPMEGDNRG